MATTTANWQSDWLAARLSVWLTVFLSDSLSAPLSVRSSIRPSVRRIQFVAEAENWCQRRNGANSLTHKFLAVKIALMNALATASGATKRTPTRLAYWLPAVLILLLLPSTARYSIHLFIHCLRPESQESRPLQTGSAIRNRFPRKSVK